MELEFVPDKVQIIEENTDFDYDHQKSNKECLDCSSKLHYLSVDWQRACNYFVCDDCGTVVDRHNKNY